MNYIFGIAILILWFLVEQGLQWSEKNKPHVNFIYGSMIFTILGIVYWVPFWLIFMR